MEEGRRGSVVRDNLLLVVMEKRTIGVRERREIDT
jgi:hypothetical protein